MIYSNQCKHHAIFSASETSMSYIVCLLICFLRVKRRKLTNVSKTSK